MSNITEQEVIKHAASQGLILWGLMQSLSIAVNRFNQSQSDVKYHALAGSVEEIANGMNDLLNESAHELLLKGIEKIKAAKRSELAFDNMILKDLEIPKFGESHA